MPNPWCHAMLKNDMREWFCAMLHNIDKHLIDYSATQSFPWCPTAAQGVLTLVLGARQ